MNKLLIGLAAVVWATGVLAVEVIDATTQPDSKRAKIGVVRDIRASAAWTGMTNQLAQYDAHYIDATNKIDQVTDAKTKAALTAMRRCVDDNHDAVVKMVAVVKKIVKALDPKQAGAGE